MAAAFGLLNPELALGALLELLTFHEGKELVIRIGMVVRDLELLASLTNMVLLSTVQAVVTIALWTSQLRVDSLPEDESVVAARRRAPRDILLIVDELTQNPALYFLVLVKWKEAL